MEPWQIANCPPQSPDANRDGAPLNVRLSAQPARRGAQGTPGPRRLLSPANPASANSGAARTGELAGEIVLGRGIIDAEIVAGRDVAPCQGVERRKVEKQIRLAAVQQIAAKPTVVQVERGRNLDGIEAGCGHKHARDARNAAPGRKARLRPQAPPAPPASITSNVSCVGCAASAGMNSG